MTPPVMPAGQAQARYLHEVCELLWPLPARAAPIVTRPAHLERGDAELIVLPGLRGPRLIVPAGRRSSAAAVRRYGVPGSAATRLATRALAIALATGLGGLLRDRITVHAPAGAQTIESHLSAVVGRQVEISVHLRAQRANRKPVLQLLTPTGETMGFAKIGTNAMTNDLIRAERAALDRISAAGLTGFRAPNVLASGQWRGLEVLVMSPLPVWLRGAPLRPGRLASAVAELAAVPGLSASPLAGGEYWRHLTGRLARAGERGHRGDQIALRDALGLLARRSGDTVVTFGASHGDWSPWNMASTRGGLLVWDWERFTTCAPYGFDLLHYWLQARARPDHADPATVAAECVNTAPALLAPLAVPPAHARLVALTYLADLSVRYLADRQAEAGARLGAPGRWLIPALLAGIDGS